METVEPTIDGTGKIRAFFSRISITYSVTVNTKDGIAVWGNISFVTRDSHALILVEMVEGNEVERAAYAHGYWNSYQAIAESQGETGK